MILNECRIGMLVHVKNAEDSIAHLGGGRSMREMIGSTATIIGISDNRKSVDIQSPHYGSWWFLPSDLESAMEEIEMPPNIFHFDETRL
jgi:hypothetical protein